MMNTPSSLQRQQHFCAMGVMSGTSMDGIDVALIETDGKQFCQALRFQRFHYTQTLQKSLRSLAAKPELVPSLDLSAIEREVTLQHVQAVQQCLIDNAIASESVDIVGLHGQTVAHLPAQHYTRQLCDGALAAKLLKRDVVSQFRLADMHHGGQGAPLTPIYHQALVQSAGLSLPVAVVNIGGIANVTYIDETHLIAFDCGPGNALMDDWMRQHFALDWDADGRHAAQGQVNQDWLTDMLEIAYFAKSPPKSLDRHEFHRFIDSSDWIVKVRQSADKLVFCDVMASLMVLTIEAIARSTQFFPKEPKSWWVCGGGSHNTYLMQALTERVQAPVASTQQLSWDAQTIEAQCFAYLAVRCKLGLAISFPSTTGVATPSTGGLYFSALKYT